MFLLSNQYVYVYMIKYSSLDAQGGESPPSCGYIFCVPFGTRKSSRPTRGVYVPIWKEQGDTDGYNIYRTVTFLFVTRKVLARVLLKSANNGLVLARVLLKSANNVLSHCHEQSAFACIPKKPDMDCILTLCVSLSACVSYALGYQQHVDRKGVQLCELRRTPEKSIPPWNTPLPKLDIWICGRGPYSGTACWVKCGSTNWDYFPCIVWERQNEFLPKHSSEIGPCAVQDIAMMVPPFSFTIWLYDWIELLLQFIGTHTWSTWLEFSRIRYSGKGTNYHNHVQTVYTQLHDLNLYNSILQSMHVFDDDDDDLKMHWNNNRWWIQADIQNFSNYFWRSESGQDEQIIFFMLSFENVSYRKKHFSCK